jgi:hypothetical protein
MIIKCLRTISRKSGISVTFSCSVNEPLLHTASHIQGSLPNENGWKWSSSDPLTFYNWEIPPSMSAHHGYCAALSQASGKREKSLL